MIDTIVQYYWNAKEWVHHGTGADPSVLHIHFGLALWLLAAFLLKKPLRDWRPFAVVLALQALNEVADRLLFGGWRWASNTSWDMIETLFWPFAIMVYLRWRK